MKTGSVIAAILLALLLMATASMAAVNNVNLTSVGTSGVTGMASTITGNVAGPTPFMNAEVNIRIDQVPAANSVFEGWLVDNQSNYKLSLGVFEGNRLTHRMKVAGMPYDAIAVSVEPANDTDPLPCTIVAQGSLPGTMVSSADFVTMAVLPEDEIFQRQVLMQRFNLTDQQIASLRMMGWGYDDISLAANVAVRCNRNINDVVAFMSQGQSWDQIARQCNMTTAMLFTPVPMGAVAMVPPAFGVPATPGAAGTGVVSPTFYLTYPNGRPVVTWQDWQSYRRAGYSWRDVAVAANIAARTGEDVSDLLRMTRIQGKTWMQISMERNLNWGDMQDVSRWPFGDDEGQNVMMVPSGAGVSGMQGGMGTQGSMGTQDSMSTPGTTGTGTDATCPPATGSGY